MYLCYLRQNQGLYKGYYLIRYYDAVSLTRLRDAQKTC